MLDHVALSRANYSRISSAISSYPYFADQFRAITNFVPIPNDSLASDTGATPDYVLDWAREKLRFCLDACASKSLGCEDGPAMVDLALYFNDSSTFLSQMCVAPVSLIAAIHIMLTISAVLRPESIKDMTPPPSFLHSWSGYDSKAPRASYQ